MKIFALQTDIELLKKRFITPDESVLYTTQYHWFLFFVRSMRSIVLSIAIIAAGIFIWRLGAPGLWVTLFVIALLLILALFPIVSAFIDWKYDFLLITNEKLVVVTQGSLFKREIRQMNLDNIASVTAQTQYMNMFPFGILCFDLKEGVGERFCLSYITESARIASIVSDAVTEFQRRRAYLQGKGAKEAEIEAEESTQQERNIQEGGAK